MSIDPGTPTPESDAQLLGVARGAGFLAGGRVFSSAARLLLAVWLARTLGADDYGLYILVISIAFAASGFGSLGLDTAMERYVAVGTRHDDGPAVRGSLQVGIVGTVVTSTLVAGLLAAFAGPMARHVFDEPRLESLLVWSALMTPLLALSTLLVAALIGFKRMDYSTLADDIVQPTARAVFLGLVAIVGMSVRGASVAFMASYVASTLVLVWLVRLAVRSVGGSSGARREVRGIAAFSFPFWLAGALRIVRVRLQPLLLGVFGSTANVGVFSVVTSAGLLGRIANLSINKALRPQMAQLHDAGDKAQIQRMYATTTRWTLAANIPVFLAMVLMPTSMLAVFGNNFTTGVTALVIVAFAELFNAATGMCGAIVAMSGYNRLKMINSVAWVISSLAANVLLIPAWGINGAALAVLVSTAFINLLRIVELWVLLRVIPWDRTVWKPLTAAALAGVAGAVMLAPMPDRIGLIAIGAVTAVITSVFFGAMFLFGLEDDDRLILGRVGQKLSKFRSSRATS